MRLYMGDASASSLRKCRNRAPGYTFGRVWTPNHNRTGAPYIVDNGIYAATMNGEEWSPDRWRTLLDEVAANPWPPDFVVLPDVYNDAAATLARHREYVDEVLDRGLRPAAVIQPGMDEETQVQLADELGAGVVFVGGENRWKRAMGETITRAAHDLGLGVHIGNPGVPGGLAWADRVGVDSLDTSSIVGSQAWHHLDELSGEGHSSSTPGIKATEQVRLSDGGFTETGTSSPGNTHAPQSPNIDTGGCDDGSPATRPSDVARTCLCGQTIPPYGQHHDWEPSCRHCQNTALSYWDRELEAKDRGRRNREEAGGGEP